MMLAAALGGLLPLLIGATMVFAIATLWMVRRIAKGKRFAIAQLDEIRGGAPALLVDPRALLFGIESAGKMQLRGNGLLSLLHSELVFTQLVPSRTFRIPLADVVGIEHPRWFLGKSYGRKLLVVAWTTEGRVERAAWFVPDLDGWVAALVPVLPAAAIETEQPPNAAVQ
ncbi:MAG: hypothetical protein IAG13_18775 [Deltaproteobacteria bacterium]|nr:hypothetical protein [Nannocystaceae bacterium]